MLGTIKSYLYGAGAALVATLVAAVVYLANTVREARDQTVKARQRAQGEKAARKHVQETTEKTNEVEDDIRKSTPDARRNELRDKYASGSRD